MTQIWIFSVQGTEEESRILENGNLNGMDISRIATKEYFDGNSRSGPTTEVLSSQKHVASDDYLSNHLEDQFGHKQEGQLKGQPDGHLSCLPENQSNGLFEGEYEVRQGDTQESHLIGQEDSQLIYNPEGLSTDELVDQPADQLGKQFEVKLEVQPIDQPVVLLRNNLMGNHKGVNQMENNCEGSLMGQYTVQENGQTKKQQVGQQVEEIGLGKHDDHQGLQFKEHSGNGQLQDQVKNQLVDQYGDQLDDQFVDELDDQVMDQLDDQLVGNHVEHYELVHYEVQDEPNDENVRDEALGSVGRVQDPLEHKDPPPSIPESNAALCNEFDPLNCTQESDVTKYDGTSRRNDDRKEFFPPYEPFSNENVSSYPFIVPDNLCLGESKVYLLNSDVVLSKVVEVVDKENCHFESLAITEDSRAQNSNESMDSGKGSALSDLSGNILTSDEVTNSGSERSEFHLNHLAILKLKSSFEWTGELHSSLPLQQDSFAQANEEIDLLDQPKRTPVCCPEDMCSRDKYCKTYFAISGGGG